MRSLVWTPAATRDVARLYDFLVSADPGAAARAVAALRHGVGILAAHPEIGRRVASLSSEFRDWFIRFGSSAYIVRYRYDSETIAILRIRHGREAGF